MKKITEEARNIIENAPAFTFNELEGTITIDTLKTLTENKYNELIDRFLKDNNAVDYHHPSKINRKVDGLVFFEKAEDEEWQIVPCGYYIDTHYFSLNPVKLDSKNNELFISTWSVAGTVKNTGDIQNDIDVYNETSIKIDRFKIRYVLMADGTIYVATKNN